MRLCSHLNNFTINWINLKFKDSKHYFIDKDGYPRGLYMDFLLKGLFLDPPKIAKKQCRFVYSDKEGDYNPLNQSYDGAIGMIANSKADIFVR